VYYCNACATKTGIEPTFWKTWTACEICGEWREVSDRRDEYKLDPDCPVMRDKTVNSSTKDASKRHGVYKKAYKTNGHKIVKLPAIVRKGGDANEVRHLRIAS
jgi:hypothetical protein